MIGSDASSPPPRTPSDRRDRPDGEREKGETVFFHVAQCITTLILVIWIVLYRFGVSALALHTHSDLCIGSPVWRCHLVSEPGGDSFGGARAVLRHWLDNVVHPIQDPLGSVLVVGQKSVRLREERVMRRWRQLKGRCKGFYWEGRETDGGNKIDHKINQLMLQITCRISVS